MPPKSPLVFPPSFSPHTIQLTPHHLNAMLVLSECLEQAKVRLHLEAWCGDVPHRCIQMQCNAVFMNCSYNVQL